MQHEEEDDDKNRTTIITKKKFQCKSKQKQWEDLTAFLTVLENRSTRKQKNLILQYKDTLMHIFKLKAM